MDWRWDWLWSIFWNAFIHAITFNWTELGRDGGRLKDWWRSLWAEIENRIRGAKSWLMGYGFGLYVQAVNWINDRIAWVRGQLSWLQGYAFGLYVQAVNWINARIGWVHGRAVYLTNLARSFASSLVQQAKNVLYPYIDYWIRWVQARFEWIQPWRDLVTNWLVRAKGVIDWLWHTAWGGLQAFLNNPIGFVLGWLLDPIRNLINWWRTYGPGLMTFVANELADLRTLWDNGKRILKALVDNPESFIFDLLAPMFLDWLAGLIADSW